MYALCVYVLYYICLRNYGHAGGMSAISMKKRLSGMHLKTNGLYTVYNSGETTEIFARDTALYVERPVL